MPDIIFDKINGMEDGIDVINIDANLTAATDSTAIQRGRVEILLRANGTSTINFLTKPNFLRQTTLPTT